MVVRTGGSLRGAVDNARIMRKGLRLVLQYVQGLRWTDKHMQRCKQELGWGMAGRGGGTEGAGSEGGWVALHCLETGAPRGNGSMGQLVLDSTKTSACSLRALRSPWAVG